MTQDIYIGSDHGGYEHKKALYAWLVELGYQVVDVGAHAHDPDDDYPQFAFAVAQAVAGSDRAVGILLCRSGAGMTIAANKIAGVRAVEPVDARAAAAAREHNNANSIVLAADWLEPKQMRALIKIFLDTPFSAHPRHARRLAQITEFEKTATA